MNKIHFVFLLIIIAAVASFAGWHLNTGLSDDANDAWTVVSRMAYENTALEKEKDNLEFQLLIKELSQSHLLTRSSFLDRSLEINYERLVEIVRLKKELNDVGKQHRRCEIGLLLGTCAQGVRAETFHLQLLKANYQSTPINKRSSLDSEIETARKALKSSAASGMRMVAAARTQLLLMDSQDRKFEDLLNTVTLMSALASFIETLEHPIVQEVLEREDNSGLESIPDESIEIFEFEEMVPARPLRDLRSAEAVIFYP